MDTSTVITRIIAENRSITRQDISDILESIGLPGELQDEKRAVIADFYAQYRQTHDTPNGSVLDTLDSYATY